jgi:hypothetical protein
MVWTGTQAWTGTDLWADTAATAGSTDSYRVRAVD